MEKNKLKILAIDDNKDNLISLMALIREAFPDSITLTATNGRTGIELAESEDPHLVVLDVIMPGIDGFEVCQRLKSNPKTCDIPVIFLTAIKGDRDSRIRALEIGAEAFLAKPIDETELTAQIRAMQKIKEANKLKKAEKETLSGIVVERTRKLELAHTATMNLLEDLRNENETRRKSEQALANEKERLAVTLRSIGDGVITTDTQCNVVIMNKVAEDLTGWKQSEAQGKPITSILNIINEGTRLPCENPAERVLSTGQIIELANHTLLVSRDGSELVIADSGAPIKDQNSVTIGVVLVFRDMTEKQKLLDVIQRTDKLDSLGVLAGGIAHDFNNMLAGMFGYIDLARASTTDKTISSYLDKSMTVFSRAKDLTQQLLTFSKGGTPQRQVSELGSLIRESASFALSGSQIGCDYDIDKDLWLANFDRNQIGQVIDNLVINAQQAMPMGGKIVISARNTVLKEDRNPLLNPGKFIKLSITDTGIGIPPDLLKRIFDPFFTTKQKGHGLGLTTSYAILRKHDGCIEAESQMGKGSVFHVFLPASNQETIQSASGTSVSHKGSGRILIMDDEPSIREILGISLKGMGYTILVAKDGEEALQICAEAASKGEHIDGAFFDLTIPGGMGGKETITQIRQQYPNLPVYATSGYSEDPVMAKPAEHGFTDSIRKPYRKDDLVSMLNRHPPKNSSRE
jgi:PAS domain S-box-containing protein